MKPANKILILTGLIILYACSQSGRREPNAKSETSNAQHSNKSPKNWSGKTVVKVQKKNGVNQVPVEINGSKMFFIFDTGAGMVSISETEAMFLYKQGTLTDNDVLGTANFIDANGDISEGTIINLKTVKVGNRTLTNIQASVIHNMQAPLLLGQTVLEQFGKISLDNNRGEITFE
jgi:aspartyl protease family protein